MQKMQGAARKKTLKLFSTTKIKQKKAPKLQALC